MLKTEGILEVKLHRFDWVLFAITVALCAIGLLNLHSATYTGHFKSCLPNQLYTSLAGVVIAFIVAVFPTRYIDRSSYLLLAVFVLLIFAVLIIGPVIHGSQRWLVLGGIRLQPSEFGKLALILALARYFADNPRPFGYGLRDLAPPALVSAVCAVLIAVEPDLGTAGLYLLLSGSISLLVGIKRRLLVIVVIVAAIALPLFWEFGLKDYQKDRILTLVDPDRDPLGAGYHVRQSVIAVGSGKAFGKHYLKGTQTKLQFLPEHHTDFAFSVWAEEWGFFGSAAVLALFGYLIYRIFTLATLVPNRFRRLALAGIGFYFFLQTAINIAMVLGIFPVVGITLPFFSYGRSSLITSFAAIGLAINFASKRYLFEE